MKRTMTTSGLVVAALALGAFAMSTLPAEAGRARSGVRIGPFPTSGAHASVTLHPQPSLRGLCRRRLRPQPRTYTDRQRRPRHRPSAASGTAPGTTPSPASLTDTVSLAVWQEEPARWAGSLVARFL